LASVGNRAQHALRETPRLYRPMLRALTRVALLVLACAALARAAETPSPPATAEPAQFSRMRAGGALAPWTPITIAFGKRATHYDLIEDDGKVVLHAVADNAASGLAYRTDVVLANAPVIAWRWKIAGLIHDADPYKASREDAPARIVLEFDGDKTKLPLVERGIYRIAERVSGRALPYATLMYIWSNRESVGTIIPNPRTHRVQMIAASSGSAGVGAWQSLMRDVRADFRRAFGEEPGRLTAVGVLTDTDNTDSHAEAWYGDIRFQSALPSAAAR
jgi:hypothetical protein